MEKNSRQRIAVYAADAVGESFLLGRGYTEQEAKEVANKYYKETGRTAVMVIQEREDNNQ